MKETQFKIKKGGNPEPTLSHKLSVIVSHSDYSERRSAIRPLGASILRHYPPYASAHLSSDPCRLKQPG
jgi:hypothetical protein